MKFEVTRQSKESIIHQIEQGIEDRINSGFLKEGEKLPSIRTLADNLNVSFLTVVKAYDNLESRSIIQKIHGKGCFVRSKNDPLIVEHIPAKWNENIKNYITRAQFHRHFNDRHYYQYNFAISCLSDYIHPQKFIENLLKDHQQSSSNLLSQYPPLQGDLSLRETLANVLEAESITTNSDELLIVNGVQQAINLVSRALLGKGDILCIEETSYPAAIDVFKWQGTTIKPIPMTKDGLDMNYLHNLCDDKSPEAIYVVPNFNNPTGILMSDKNKCKLLELAQLYNFLIIEDDTWSDLYFTKEKPKTIKSMDTTGNVIYLKGFSKIIGGGYRIGVISATEQIINILTAAKSISDLGTPHMTQLAVDGILNSKEYKEELTKRRQTVIDKKNLMMNTIKKYGNNKVKCITPSGGLCLWLSLCDNIDTNFLLLKARQNGINFLPGHIFYSSLNKKNNLRLTYGHLEDDVIEAGVIKLMKLINE